MLLAACAPAAAGCSSPEQTPPAPAPRELVVESRPAIELAPGQAFHFADHFRGGKVPGGLERRADGTRRLALGDVRQPVLCAPAPYLIKQKVRLPERAALRTAFGLAPQSWNRLGRGVRFVVRLRRAGETRELLSEELSRWRGPDTSNWSPVIIDLSEGPGEEVEIELGTEMSGEPRAGAPEDFVGAYALWVNPTLIAAREEPRPNIVLVFIDALRADHLGCYGYRRNTSPFLDRLSQESIVFEDASAQATWTLPSTLSLLTSSYGFVRGSRVGRLAEAAPAGSESQLLVHPVAMPHSLPGELRKAGYATLACVGGGFLDPALGFDSGFDWYWSPGHTPMLADQLSVLKRQLSSEPRTPFFLFLHTYEVHNFFQGWAHFLERFDSGYLGRLTDPRRLMQAALHDSPDELSAADLQYLHDLYDGEILHSDRYLRLFLEWLLNQPWGNNTMVVITADHGESLGDHGAMTHGGVPYREVARVPLLLRLPDGRRRRRVTEPVALVDLMPTLLDVVGVDPPPGLVGRSLVSLWETGGTTARPSIFCESRGAAMLARVGRWCYLSYRGEGEEELYDLGRDPGQTQNLAGTEPEQIHRMRRVLADLAMRAARGYRLVVAGPRPAPLTVELTCDSPFSYLDVPTLQQGDGVSVAGAAGQASSADSQRKRAQIVLSPGDDPHVILFERADPDSTVTVSARLGDQPVGAARFRLGRDQTQADRTPVSIGPATRPVLSADEPPLSGEPDTWGIWIWLPAIADAARRAAAPSGSEMPGALLEQLRSLGYLR